MQLTEEQAKWFRVGIIAFLNSMMLTKAAQVQPDLAKNHDFVTVAAGAWLLLDSTDAQFLETRSEELKEEIGKVVKQFYSTVGADA